MRQYLIVRSSIGKNNSSSGLILTQLDATFMTDIPRHTIPHKDEVIGRKNICEEVGE